MTRRIGALEDAFLGAGADSALAVVGLPSPRFGDPLWASLSSRTAVLRFVEDASQVCGGPWPTLTARQWARFHRDGNRTEYEEHVWERQRRLTRAVVAALVTGEGQYLDEVADGTWALCEQSSWCWPAHDDAHQRSGSVLPDTTSPYLDLGAGEVAAQLAWTDHLLGEELDRRYPGLRSRVRREVDGRVLSPMLKRRDWHWLGLTKQADNWTAWIHQNVLIASLAFVAPGARRESLVRACLQGLDRYVDTLPADGAPDEGHAYWWQGPARALRAAELLKQASRGRIDLIPSVPRLARSISFPHQMHIGGPWSLAIADSTARGGAARRWQLLHAAARSTGNEVAASYAVENREESLTADLGLDAVIADLADQEWAAATPMEVPPRDDVWIESIQVRVVRPAEAASAGLTLTVKGGHNAEHHNHNDVGSITVSLGGVPVAVDPGRKTYDATTFGPDRYQAWNVQGAWHCLPLIGGREQQPGARFAARNARATETGLVLDLAGAHDAPGTWIRTAELDRPSGRITVREQWSGIDPVGRSALRWVFAARKLRVEGNVIKVLPVAGENWLAIQCPGPVQVEEASLHDPELVSVWGDRLFRATVDLGGAPDGEAMTVFSRDFEQEGNRDVRDAA